MTGRACGNEWDSLPTPWLPVLKNNPPPNLLLCAFHIYVVLTSVCSWKTFVYWEVGGGCRERSGGQSPSFQKVPKPTFSFLCPVPKLCPPSSCPFFFPSVWLCPGLTWKGHGQKMVIPAPELYTRANLALGKFWGLCTPLEKSNGQEKYMKTLHGGEKVDAGQVG